MKPFAAQSYYELLEISASASAAEIRGAWQRLNRMYADDQVALYGLATPETAAALRKRLKEAMEVLSDDELRAMYDEELGLPPREPQAEEPASQLEMGELLRGAEQSVASTHPRVAFTWSEPGGSPVASPPSPSAPGPVPAQAPSAPRPVAPEVSVSAASGPGAASAQAAAPSIEQSAPVAARSAAVAPPSAGATAPEGAFRAASSEVAGQSSQDGAMSPVTALSAPVGARSADGAATATGPEPSAPDAAPSAPLASSGPVQAHSLPVAAPSAPVPSPSASDAAPSAPLSAPSAPVPPPSAPVAAPSAPAAPPRPADAERISGEAALSMLPRASPTAAPRPSAPPAAPERPRMPDLGPDAEYNGELLRKVRAALGLSLAEVAERTRIGAKHLENVEADRYDALPATVYLRGILMSLAKELRLDGLKVARSYLSLVERIRSKG